MDTIAQLSRLTLELNRAARRQPPEGFVGWVVTELSRCLDVDGGFWGSGHVDPQGRPVLHSRSQHHLRPLMGVEPPPAGCFDALLAESARRPGESIALDATSQAMPGQLGPAHGCAWAHALTTSAIEPLTGLYSGFGVWRHDAACPFTEAERLFMQAVFPHLAEARQHNRLQQLAQVADPSARSAWLAAAADRQGLLHHADEPFVRLLHEEWPGWAGPRLPPPLERLLGGDPAQRYLGRQLVGKCDVMGDLVRVLLRRGEAVDRLTPREREIAVYTAQGLTHKEIARRLELAPATVRTHLTASCRRLGAKNKAQMAAWVHSLA